MELDDDILRLARRLLTRLVDETALRLPEGQKAEIRSYYESKGGLYRQLAGRALQAGRRGLGREEAVSWAIADLRTTVLSRAPSSELRQQFEYWFTSRLTMLRGVTSQFWRWSQELLGAMVERRRQLGISSDLLLKYLSVPLSVEADVARRTAGNLAAIDILASGRPIGEPERLVLAGYTGWGGLSIERVAERLPAKWTPDSSALIHEYYTPPMLCFELARVLRRYVDSLARMGKVTALEPSAGIGRFVHALSLDGYEQVDWTAVEYSPISAGILRAMRPDIRVVEDSFESFVAREEAQLGGQVQLVVTNPPYGERGATIGADPNPAYQDRKAYPYFLIRGLDLLAPSGVGAFVVPYGFLTGQSAELYALRKRVLRRHHLMAGFRLPSSMFPGANIVTDLLLFRSRGGELSDVAAEDQPILEGRYFELFPTHLLGQEIRGDAAESEPQGPPTRSGKKARFGYEVLGTFTKLPDFEERPLCTSCAVTRPSPAVQKSADVAEYLLPPEIQTAITLGKRVARYLGLLSSTDEKLIELAQRQHSELLTSLTDFRALWSGSPRQDRTLAGHAKSRKDIVALLSAYTESGEVVSQLRERPSYRPRYGGALDDVVGQALYLFRTERSLTMASLVEFRRTLGRPSQPDVLRRSLMDAGWAFDGEEWLPASEYFTGSLWPRYDRARAAATSSTPAFAGQQLVAENQAVRLLQAIAPVTLSVVEPDPRLPWVPLTVVRPWVESFVAMPTPEFERRNHYLVPKGIATVDLLRPTTPSALAVVIGFLNHDYQLFKIPNAPKEVDVSTGKEETESNSQARARLDYEQKALNSFRLFLRDHPSEAEQVVDAYNRTYRGYIEPTYTEFSMPARWGARVELREHQKAGAARLLAHAGGLLAFDVGVGKTYTGIATLARLREEGKARRPVVIVPNSLLFQWLKQFQKTLPDYRVLVIGAERYIGRSGTLVSRTDKPEERAAKWRIFQAGGADVVIASYTVFARAAVRFESRARFVWSSPPMLKLFGMEARKAEADATEPEDKKKKKRPKKASDAQLEKLFGAKWKGMTKEELDQAAEQIALDQERQREAERQRIRQLIESLSSYSERERAVIQNRIERWASLAAQEEDADPGIYWEELGIDALFLDEAQNMKNLWPVTRGGGEPPKYLGAIDRPTQRALDFAIRAYLVRRKNGGSGVYLLSATPAKNSPLEYFSLLSLVDGEAWARLGITDTSDFISRYLKIETKEVLDTDLQETIREVVTGFRNIPELRDIIFRFAEFRTAEEVGLKLPKSETQTIKVPMDEAQQSLHRALLSEYRVLIQDRSAGARNKALGILMQLSMVSIHPALVAQRPEGGWSRSNWNRVREYGSPKLLRCVEEILRKRRCGHIVFVESVATHYWLREVLVAAGIPRERIAILNAEEAPTALRRQVIAEKFNGTPAVFDENGNLEMEAIPPEYDVVIANSVANEGIDLHIFTCLVHHLDLPWEPATLQQRNGRAVRQGNTQSVIGIHYYISQGSIDAARLTIILGKLTWMKDILQSSERETNNPAAGSELSQDELVAFLYSPEELTTLRVQMAKRREEEDRRVARRRAWTLAKRIAEHREGAAKTPVEMGQEDHAIRELLRQLKEIPAQSWPWHNTVISNVLDGYACAFFDLRYRPGLQGQPDTAEQAGEDLVVTVALWERAVFTSTSEGGRAAVQFQVGLVKSDEVSLRLAGTTDWLLITPLLLNASQTPLHISLHLALRHATPEQFSAGKWNSQIDKLEIEQRLLEVLPTVSSKGIAALGMRFAPDVWRLRLWETWSKQVLERLPRAFLVPVESGPLFLSVSALGATSPLPLPWTEKGFRLFVERAKAEKYTWTELNQASESWFERPFPKGVLGKSQADPVTVWVKDPQGNPKQAPVTWMRGGLAVTSIPAEGADGVTVWTVTHLGSGKAIHTFSSPEIAERFAEWALTLPMNWEQADEAKLLKSLPDPNRIKVLARWVATQTAAPSLDAMQKFFRQL